MKEKGHNGEGGSYSSQLRPHSNFFLSKTKP